MRQGWSGRGRGSDPPSPSSPRPRSAGFLCHKSLFEGPSAGRPGSGGRCPEPMQRAPPGSGCCSGGRAAGTDWGGGAPRRLSPPALAPVSVRSAGCADPSAGGTGRWGQCARTCLGDRSARPAVGPAPPPGPRLFAPTQARSPPSAAPTATCPHVKAGFVLRSGMHAEVSGAESLPRQPPCRSGQESGLRPEHCVWRAWILGRKRQVLFQLRNLPCIFTAEKRVPAPKVPRFFFFGLDGKFL